MCAANPSSSGLGKQNVKSNVAVKKSASKNPLQKRALLVESDLLLKSHHYGLLTDLGFQITLASNDRIASRLLTENSYDLIVLHDALPEVNALLLMKVIQYSALSRRNNHTTTFLLHQEDAMPDELKSVFMAHGFHYFLALPLNVVKLNNLIESAQSTTVE